jgi:hypothetical protein
MSTTGVGNANSTEIHTLVRVADRQSISLNNELAVRPDATTQVADSSSGSVPRPRRRQAALSAPTSVP